MMISEQTILAAIFYFGQVFVFCWLINKNVLEWCLLIMYQEHTLIRSTFLADVSLRDRQLPVTRRTPAQSCLDEQKFACLTNNKSPV